MEKPKKMDIIFVNPFFFEKDSYSIGVLNLVSILDKVDITNSIVDFNYAFGKEKLEMNIDECTKYLLKYNSKIIAFSCMSNCYYFYLKIAEKIKEISSNYIIVFGGPQATLTANRTMQMFPFIDAIFLGESELSIENNVKYFLGKGTKDSLRNVVFRLKDKIIVTESCPLITDLDSLPQINYKKLLYWKSIKVIMLESGRGCPYECSFCSTKTFWKRKPRLKSIDRLIKEIKYVETQYKLNDFSFVHDLFTFNKKFVFEFCTTLLNEKINITWSCSARVDTVDDELIEIMFRAGCRRIFFGVEVGSQNMQRKINKNLNLQKINPILKSLKRFSFTNVTFSFIYNFPDETEESIRSTVELLLYIMHEYNYDTQLSQFCMLPETELYDKYKNHLTLTTIESSMTLSLPLNLNDKWINSAPDIFTQYYIVDSEIYRKYTLLEPFMDLYKSLFQVYHSVLEIIMHYFNGNFFRFYEEFSTDNSQWLIKYFANTSYVKELYENEKYLPTKLGLEIVHYVKKWLFKKHDFIDKEFLNEAVNYITLMAHLYLKKCKTPKVVIYNNDVVGLNHKRKYSECKSKCIKVLLQLTEEGTFRVKRAFFHPISKQ